MDHAFGRWNFLSSTLPPTPPPQQFGSSGGEACSRESGAEGDANDLGVQSSLSTKPNQLSFFALPHHRQKQRP